MFRTILYCLVICIVLSSTLSAKEMQSHRPDAHAPISIMSDHLHKAGEFMSSHRIMHMTMTGNKQGSTDLGDASAVIGASNYMSAPESMSMTMNMLGGMYGVSDDLTVMFMLPIISNSMTSKAKANGAFFNSSTSGLGDISIAALKSITRTAKSKSHFTLGLSLPTGQTDATGAMMGGNIGVMGYGMQLGSGSLELRPSYTHTWFTDTCSYGAQVGGALPVGKNSNGYQVGSTAYGHAWVAKPLTHSFSSSVRLSVYQQGRVIGSHNGIGNILMSPLMDPANTGKSTVSLGLGGNYIVPSGFFKDVRFAGEISTYLFEHVNGLQPKSDAIYWTIGGQKVW